MLFQYFSHISRSIQGCSVLQHWSWSRFVFNQVLYIFIRTAKIRIRLYFTKHLFPTIIRAFSFQTLLWRISSIHLQTILFGLQTRTIFIVAPCILIYVEFTHQQMHFYYFKEHIKIYIKISINIAPTCFGLRPSLGSLQWTWLKLYLC